MKKRAARILVVDDEALMEYMILQKFHRQIREEQYCFVFAPNGVVALDALQAEAPIDMVLTDIRMPEMDGLTLLEKLRDRDEDIKAVVVSAYDDLQNIRAAMNRGAFDFLTKPIDLDDLDITIQKTLDHIAKLRDKQEQLQQAQEKLRFFAFNDVLTNLPNRALFLRMLEHALDLHQRTPDHTYAVMLLDLNRFKMINDSHGHLVGDYLLISVATRLQDSLRSSDTIARLGGDEFAILIEGLRDGIEVLPVIQRIERSLTEPFQIGEHLFHISASIGITTSAVSYTHAGDVLRDADVAMYQAKVSPSSYTIFDPSMHSQIAERLQLETDIRLGMARGELCNFYQPIVDMRTGQLLGFEALARWNHPQHGWISPARFIEVTEETGLIHSLSRALFQEAADQLRRWLEAFPGQLFQLNINVSPVQLQSQSFASEIRAILAGCGLSGKYFKLELIESALLGDPRAYSQLIYDLLDLDLRLCIDDFGTGYSSLTRLHAFPIATLKIDQSFVRKMQTSKPHLITVKIIIALAQMLSMDVVAEGVESDAERQHLIALGCSIGQGYLLSQPLDSVAATAYIAAHLSASNDSNTR